MRNQFHSIKNYIIVCFTILIFTGCAPKVWDYRVTEKAPKISDTELSNMSTKEFYSFLRKKDYDINYFFSYTDAYDVVERYCKLKGSALLNFDLQMINNKYIPTTNGISGTYEFYDRWLDYGVHYGCDLKETNEFIGMIRLESHLKYHRNVDDLKEYLIDTGEFLKTPYHSYQDEKDRKELLRISTTTQIDEFRRVSNLDDLVKIAQYKKTRRGTYEATFFMEFYNKQFKRVYSDDVCVSSCLKIAVLEHGFIRRDDVKYYGWDFQKELGPSRTTTTDGCTCVGKKYLIKK